MKYDEYIDIRSLDIARWFVSHPAEYMEIAAKHARHLYKNTGIGDMAYVISGYKHDLEEVMSLMAFEDIDVKAPYYWCDDNTIVSLYDDEEGFCRLMRLFGCRDDRTEHIKYIAELVNNAISTGLA